MPMADSYPPPVDQLLTLGEMQLRDKWLDYRALGLGETHAAALIEMLSDDRLQWAARRQGEQDTRRFWAPAHAWRALGQLRAPDAVEPLIRMLLRWLDSDWPSEEIPQVLGMIGPAALPAVREALRTAATDEEPMGAARLGAALVAIGRGHPQARADAVSVAVEQLRAWPDQHPTVNAFLVSDLIDLNAVAAAPLMEEAFAADAVDESVTGDWEDVRIELGLLEGRITPLPRYDWGKHRTPAKSARTAPPTAAPVPGSDSAAAKARSLRKAQKANKRKGRR
jgi:hypothetical protein